MELKEREKIFKEYPKIGTLIRDFQSLGFDPDEDDPEERYFDAIALPAKEIDFANYILMLPHKDITTYPRHLAETLYKLLEELKCEALFILAHTKHDLFGNPGHPDRELIRVREKLQKHLGRTEYTESIAVETKELDSLIDVFFWLTRLDPQLPEYIFWIDQAQRFCFFICRYGNIHLLSLVGLSLLTEEWLNTYGFRVGEDYDQFTDPGKATESN